MKVQCTVHMSYVHTLQYRTTYFQLYHQNSNKVKVISNLDQQYVWFMCSYLDSQLSYNNGFGRIKIQAPGTLFYEIRGLSAYLCKQDTALCSKYRADKHTSIRAAQRIKHGRRAWDTVVPALLLFYSILFYSILFYSILSYDNGPLRCDAIWFHNGYQCFRGTAASMYPEDRGSRFLITHSSGTLKSHQPSWLSFYLLF
jgi:hypothetical protein